MANYEYTPQGQNFTITVNGELKTYTVPLHTMVTIPHAPIHVFSEEVLKQMGVPEKIIVEERDNRSAAQMSGGIHMSYCFYYIKCDEPDKLIWIESDTEAQQLRKDIADSLAEHVSQREHEMNAICTFCGEKEFDCGADHGDEMRDIVRKTTRYY